MTTARAVMLALLAVTACGPSRRPTVAPAGTAATQAADPLARLAALDLELAGKAWEGRCQLELTTREGALVARLDEEALARFVAPDAFEVEVVHRYDNRYQRGGVDSMRAVLADGVLAVRRQAEPFARVPNLHDEAKRYRDIGLGLFPALVAAFAAETTREDDRLQLVLATPAATPDAERPARHDRAWQPAFRAALSNVTGGGELTWPAEATCPSAGSLHVSAALNGHALNARCTLVVTSLPTGARVDAPSPLLRLDRPRVHRDLDDFLRRLEPPDPPGTPRAPGV